MKSKIVISLLVCLTFQIQAQDSMSSSFGREMITRDELIRSGASKLSDIFSLVNSGVVNTLDGYRWQLNINGLTPNWDQRWILYLDNQRVDLDYPYIKNINLLPIGLSEINYVEVITLPGIVEGEFNDSGLIHIHTLPVPENISFNFSFASANETGDPGPYKYTNSELGNIDQIGPYYWGSLKWRNNNVNISLGLKHHLHITSDPLINHRFPVGTPWEYKQLRMIGISLKLNANILGGNHSLFISRTETGDPVIFPGYGSDLIFFKPLGKEIPVEPKFTHAGINGIFNLDSELKLVYRLKFSSSLLDWTLAPINNLFDWNINNYSGIVELKNSRLFYGTNISLGFQHVNFITGYNLENDSFTLIKLNGQAEVITSKYYKQKIFGGIVFDGSDRAIKIGSDLVSVISENIELSANLSYGGRLPKENNNLWYWIRQGYDFLNDNNLTYSIDNELKNSNRITGEFEFRFNEDNKFTSTAGLFYRKFWSYYLEKQQYNYLPDKSSFDSTTLLSTSENGLLAGIRIYFHHHITDFLSHSLFYQNILTYEGSDIFVEGWHSIPQHKLRYTIDYFPISSFSIKAMITYFSETYWEDYSGINSDSYGLYSYHVADNLLIDISVVKSFWREKLRMSLLLQNVLGKYILFHPLSALFDTTLFMKVELMLN